MARQASKCRKPRPTIIYNGSEFPTRFHPDLDYCQEFPRDMIKYPCNCTSKKLLIFIFAVITSVGFSLLLWYLISVLKPYEIIAVSENVDSFDLPGEQISKIPTVLNTDAENKKKYAVIKLKNGVRVLLISSKSDNSSLFSFTTSYGPFYQAQRPQELSTFSIDFAEATSFFLKHFINENNFNISTAEPIKPKIKRRIFPHGVSLSINAYHSRFEAAVKSFVDVFKKDKIPLHKKSYIYYLSACFVKRKKDLDYFNVLYKQLELEAPVANCSYKAFKEAENMSEATAKVLNEVINDVYNTYFRRGKRVITLRMNKKLDYMIELANTLFGQLLDEKPIALRKVKVPRNRLNAPTRRHIHVVKDLIYPEIMPLVCRPNRKSGLLRSFHIFFAKKQKELFSFMQSEFLCQILVNSDIDFGLNIRDYDIVTIIRFFTCKGALFQDSFEKEAEKALNIFMDSFVKFSQEFLRVYDEMIQNDFSLSPLDNEKAIFTDDDVATANKMLEGNLNENLLHDFNLMLKLTPQEFADASSYYFFDCVLGVPEVKTKLGPKDTNSYALSDSKEYFSGSSNSIVTFLDFDEEEKTVSSEPIIDFMLIIKHREDVSDLLGPYLELLFHLFTKFFDEKKLWAPILYRAEVAKKSEYIKQNLIAFPEKRLKKMNGQHEFSFSVPESGLEEFLSSFFESLKEFFQIKNFENSQKLMQLFFFEEYEGQKRKKLDKIDNQLDFILLSKTIKFFLLDNDSTNGEKNRILSLLFTLITKSPEVLLIKRNKEALKGDPLSNARQKSELGPMEKDDLNNHLKLLKDAEIPVSPPSNPIYQNHYVLKFNDSNLSYEIHPSKPVAMLIFSAGSCIKHAQKIFEPHLHRPFSWMMASVMKRVLNYDFGLNVASNVDVDENYGVFHFTIYSFAGVRELKLAMQLVLLSIGKLLEGMSYARYTEMYKTFWESHDGSATDTKFYGDTTGEYWKVYRANDLSEYIDVCEGSKTGNTFGSLNFEEGMQFGAHQGEAFKKSALNFYKKYLADFLAKKNQRLTIIVPLLSPLYNDPAKKKKQNSVMEFLKEKIHALKTEMALVGVQ